MSGFFWGLFATIDIYYHAATVGLNPLQLVLVGTTLEITILLCEVPTGILADLYSRRLAVIIGYALFGIGVLIEGSFPSFLPILIGNVLWGVGVSFLSGAEEAWIADELGEKQPLQPVFLRATQWKQWGGLLAIPASILLAHIAIQLPILICGCAHLFLAAFLTLTMPERGFHPAPIGERQPLRQFRAGLSLVRAKRLLLVVIGITLFYGMYSEGFDRLWTKHLLDHYTLPLLGSFPIILWWGVLRGISSFLAIILAEFTRRQSTLASGTKALWLLSGITLGISLGMLLYANSRWIGLALLAYIGIEALRTLYAPLFFAWINDFLKSEVRATVISLISQLDAVGQILGGPIIGIASLRGSTRLAISSSALLLLPALPLYALILHLINKKAHANVP